MSVHKTPDGTYRVRYWEGDRQRSKTFPTKADAGRYDAEVKRRRLEGKPVHRQQDAPVLSDFIVDWLAGRTDLSDKTLISYSQALDTHVLPHLGTLKVHGSELRPAVLAEWQRERLAAGAGPSIIKRARGVLSQVLDSAVLPHELLDSNPIAPVKPPKVPPTEPRIITAIDVERVRQHLIKQGDIGSATLVSVLAYVGVRPQDGLGLEWGHTGTKLQVIQKNVDGRIVPGSKTGMGYRRKVNLPNPVRADLEGWRVASGGSNQGLIFPRSSDHLPWKETDYRNWRGRTFGKAAEAAGLGNLNPYDLRHTCASLLAAAGWNHLEIAAQQGNSPETSVKVYQHLIQVELGERRSIDEWITEARAEVARENNVPSEFPISGD
ncbi:MAG: site-specific integrase [Solirubrobacterales bacterium]|nr:site-specific integrase [Solirubrobacterales bacterium]